jgi:hypothetical protein
LFFIAMVAMTLFVALATTSKCAIFLKLMLQTPPLLPSSLAGNFANFKTCNKLADFTIRQWSIKVLDFYFMAHLISLLWPKTTQHVYNKNFCTRRHLLKHLARIR